MAVSTVGEYLSALEKSKLLGSEQLAEAQRLARQSSDAAGLAKALASQNLVSRWQAGTLLALGQRAQLRLGKYKLIQRLGQGGMGTVFLGEHVTMNRRVALKIVPRAITEDRALLDRFFAEARAIAALDHPNIVKAYSVDYEMDRYLIVMEYVDGQDLQQLVEGRGPLDFDRAADYIRQAAEGLAHAHARNLVHCDIKPSNLLVNGQGVIKILDLGLARLNQSDEPRGAGAGEPAFGTVDYMAPEQAMESANFDHRADIYSLGCTLYFLLTGHPPFPEGTLAQRLVKHQTQEPRDILLERPDTPPKLVETCKRMMAKEPENRYQSMLEVSAALGPRLNGSSPAPAARQPQQVKLLHETSTPVGEADDWFSVLAASGSSGTSGSMKTSTSKVGGRSSKSGKGQNKNGLSSGAMAAVRAKLAWFNTGPRKIAGAAGGIAAIAALVGLASLPFLPSGPAPQTAAQPKAEEKKVSDEDKNLERTLDISRKLREKNAPDWNAPVPKGPAKPSGQPQAKPDVKPQETSPKAAPPKQPEVAMAPKAEVKPAADQKPLPPAKPVSFDGLLAAVDLPPLSKGGVSLGKLDLDPKQKVEAQLLGGEMVARGNPSFDVQKAGEGPEAGWSLEMTERNRDAVKIAHIWQEDGECKFEWTADARDRATLVRYCGLKFSSEGKSRFVALTAPKIVPPLVIDTDTGTARAHVSREFGLPDPALLRFQVLPLEKGMPKSTIKIQDARVRAVRRGKPAEAIAGDTVPVRGHVIVVLTKEKTPPVNIRISFEARGKDVMLDMASTCEVSLQTVPFNLQSLQGVAADLNAFIMFSDASQKKNGGKATVAAEKVQAAKMAKDEVKALGELAGELGQKSSIPFRVYSVLGEATDEAAPKVVIFQSGPMENPKAASTKKNAKGAKAKGGAGIESNDLKMP
jgi:serine/threonine protein kinase